MDPFVVKVMRLPSPMFTLQPTLSWNLDDEESTMDDLMPPAFASPTKSLMVTATTNNNNNVSMDSQGPVAPLSLPSFAPIQTPIDDIALKPSLSIPSSIGNVFVGETFRSCITFINTAEHLVFVFGVKIELQTPSRRWTILDTTAPPPATASVPAVNTTPVSTVPANMSPNDLKAFNIQQLLNEVGVNCLIATIIFKDLNTHNPPVPSSVNFENDPARRQFQKFFKFHVYNPLNVNTVVIAKENLFYAECTVTNLLQRSIFIQHVELSTSADLFKIIDLSNTSGGDGNGTLLCAGGSQSFLFSISETKPGNRFRHEIGRIVVRWKSGINETGRMKYPPIHYTTNVVHKDVELQLIHAPATINLEHPFTLDVTIRNNHPTNVYYVRLVMQREKMGSIQPFGNSNRGVGILHPGQIANASLQCIAVGLGLQRISGLRVTCFQLLPSELEDVQKLGLPPNCATLPFAPTTNPIHFDFDQLHNLEVIPVPM